MQKNTYSGKFIVFEGLDGSGSTTQANKLRDFLNEIPKKFVLGRSSAFLTKEPTNNIIGGLIRGQLTSDWKSSPECLQLLFSADRAHHLEKEILPLLKEGIDVVTDRYFLSTVAYGASEIKDMDWLIELNRLFIAPDITFLLKVSPKICIERINKDRFHIELFEREESLTKVWQNYEELAKRFADVYIINGERPIEEVFEEIKSIVHSKLNI
ncbi:MAG: dTMP kinase [Candidatus Nealsonbacteria bacterium]|nr:dTMP kinase [Candidatus Nealsonbacteria bacterium]